MKRARMGSLHCLAFEVVSWYNVLAVLIVASAAAELIINAGTEDTANVHIQIRCDEVAEAPEMLTDPALAEYIPEDGIAMARLKYIAKEGDSVLQILEKICKNNNIEVKKTEDGLIEAIGYLKNGDCKVMGGEEIVWAFTLNGGNDIENV